MPRCQDAKMSRSGRGLSERDLSHTVAANMDGEDKVGDPAVIRPDSSSIGNDGGSVPDP
jgi:hypothetical protein